MYRAVRGKEDQLLAGEVDVQPNNGWEPAVYRKPEQPPAGLMRGEIPTILILTDLVDSIGAYGNLCHSLIRPLVDILIEVLNRLHRAAEFDVDVGIISLRQIGIVWNDPAVVQRYRSALLLAGLQYLPSIGSPTVCWVFALLSHCFFAKRLGESLGAFPISHASGVGVVSLTARAVDHVSDNDIVKLRISILVGYLGAADSVSVSSRVDPFRVVKNEENVSVG